MSFRMAMTAATALSQRQQHEEAMQRFRQLAIDMPEMANSPAVHRLAIYHAGQLASDHSSDRLDQLSELLTEHVTRWSNSPDIDAVRFQSGGVNELRGDMVSAIRDYQSIGPEFQQMDRVVYAAARCYVGLIESMPPDSPERIRSAKEAVDWFGQQIGTARNTASIASARFLLDCLGTEPGSYARAETMLDELLDPGRSDRTQLPESTLLESQRSEAAALRFFAIAAQGQAEQAGQRLAELRGQPVDQLAATLTDLSQLADSSSDNMRRRLAAAQLQLVETINRRAAELSHDDQMNVERIAVRALLHSSETERGLAACRQLIERYPDQMANHPGVLTDYARLLAVKGDRPSLELALTYWRRLESGYREGSQSWLHAKYEVAALHAQLGNTERAKQVVRLLQILYPDLGGSNLKAKFLRLLEKQ